MNNTTRKLDQLLFYFQDFKDTPLYQFKRKYGLQYFHEALIEIENIFPQLEIFNCYDYDIFKTRYIFRSNETRKILGHLDVEDDESVYQIICKIIRACENYVNQHTIEKSNDVVLQIHHCTCCGAVLKRGSYKCEYCDAEYW